MKMGFSSALQGRAAHEALLVRLDAEIRLMEIMKRSILVKAKFDKEYSINLAAVAQQGLKLDRADDLQGSLITKSWRTYMDELDHQAKQFKTNAELLEVVCEKMSHLSQDKRKARKAYQEEHTRIAARLNHLTDEVIRKKTEYQKHLEGYKALRTRFEEHYIKSGRGGRKLDDVRDKYQKACRKLHLTHNEYVMLITEAIEVEKDFRTVLLPGLLEHQQSIQESFILLWKNILQEATQYSDLTSDKFKEFQRRIESAINSINPAEEYREFTERHKTSPASPIQFQFDEALLEDIPGKLQSNALTVDNLTVDWLRTRLSDLEIAIKDCQEKQEKMLCDLNGSTLHTNGGINGLGKDTHKQSKDLNSLRCQEKQKQKLADMIKTALSEVGCEELPSGCDDHLGVEQNFIENNFNNEQPGSSNSATSLILQRGAGVMSLLRGPFKRKSTPLTPTAKQRQRANTKARSQSLGSLSVNSASDSEAIELLDKATNKLSSSSKSVLFVDESTNTYADINDFTTSTVATTTCASIDCDTNNVPSSSSSSSDMDKIETPQNQLLTVEINRTDSPKSSINVRFDQIDEINKSLDDKMTRPQPDESIEEPKINYDAITEVKVEENERNEMKISPQIQQQLPQSPPPTVTIVEPHEIKSILKDTKDTTPLQSSEDSSALFTGVIPKKRSSSFSNRSINSILSTLKEMSFTRNFSSSKSYQRRKSTDCTILTSSNQSGGKTTSLSMDGKFLKQSSKRMKNEKKMLKSKKSLRTTFRTRLQMFNSNKNKSKCDKCSKRRIHPSKSVADFKKEFHTDEMFENEFCVCNNGTSASANTNNPSSQDASTSTSTEDNSVITIKEHTYCEPFGMSFTGNRPLYEEEWFHGVLPREEVVRLLKNDGDFLVRETIRNEESQIVLSVSWSGHKHFIVQTTADGHYRFEGPPFPSIQELIMHQYQSELPVTVKSGAILRRPVMRERWELSNDDVILLEKIGRGNFGDVYKAKLKSTKLDVAVKTCRMTLPDEQKRKFLQEGRILKQYDHPNIVKLIGICVQKQPIMIVMELVPGGSLLNFLRKNSNTLNTKQLMGMCKDAAAGMRYLEMKNCIHRDLAARNCLIDFENSVKISDFGMSREEEEYIVSDGMKQIPVKWTAPEALNFGKYTSLCDVWSYAILMWEIFSKGDTPYSGMSNSRARERIDAGFRMPAPENTPPEMYRLMLKCWSAEPESRPHFDEIYTVVEALMLRE